MRGIPDSVASELSGGITDIVATNSAYSALTENGGIVTWGHYSSHGNISLRQNPVTSGVAKLFSNYYAFAALTDNNGVISWGWGINANATINAPELASGVQDIVGHPMGNSFSALKTDGSVIQWGYGSRRTVSPGDSDINKIFANQYAFVGLKDDGTVVAWGEADSGGSLTGVSF